MSDKTLSQRLRELREAVVPKACDEHDPITKRLDECIAQAEAQEAQAGELSDERIDAEIEQWFKDPKHALYTDQGHARYFARHLRDHGYLRPSQPIGEQTPVSKGEIWHPDPWLIGNVEAWKKEPPTQVGEDDDERRKQARAELAKVMAANGWDIYGGSDYPWVVAMNYAWQEGWLDAFTRSPMSSEARDLAEKCVHCGRLRLLPDEPNS